ncbi:MAG: hypothetical protein LBF71_02695 [Campylobacteraceae bacterium]|jgi:chloramphenicol 3-O-phosphotransferase|nr:hypothetical protein [Campylobacteraceae bacterium]
MKVYLCSPYSGGDNSSLNPNSIISPAKQRRERNKRYALEMMLRVMKERKDAVFAPHLLYTAILNDDVAIDRRMGLEAGFEFLKACDMLLVGDRYGISEGMRLEIEFAEKQGIRVVTADEYLPKGKRM